MCGAALTIPPFSSMVPGLFSWYWAGPQPNDLGSCLCWSLVEFLALKPLQKFWCPTAAWCAQAGSLRQLQRSTSIHSRDTARPCPWHWKPQGVFDLVYLTSGIEGRFLCQIPQECHATLQCYTWYGNIDLCAYTFHITLEGFILMGGSCSNTDGRSQKHSYHLWSFSRHPYTMAVSLLRIKKKNLLFLADF